MIFFLAIVAIILVLLSMEKKYVIQVTVEYINNTQMQVEAKKTIDVYNAEDTVFAEISGGIKDPNANAILSINSPLTQRIYKIDNLVYFFENIGIISAKDLNTNHKEYTYSITLNGVQYHNKVYLDLKAIVNDIVNTLIIAMLGVFSSLLCIYEQWRKRNHIREKAEEITKTGNL